MGYVRALEVWPRALRIRCNLTLAEETGDATTNYDGALERMCLSWRFYGYLTTSKLPLGFCDNGLGELGMEAPERFE
jgi:hypothetical protein